MDEGLDVEVLVITRLEPPKKLRSRDPGLSHASSGELRQEEGGWVIGK